MLEIKGHTKVYGEGKKAADNVNLTVEAGDIYGFIGHNGAGKSTTIRAVVGVLDFTEGEILIDGHSVKDEPIECKKITAYIPDNPDLYENLSGIQYLNFIADVFQISAEEREASIRKYSDMLELTDSLGDQISRMRVFWEEPFDFNFEFDTMSACLFAEASGTVVLKTYLEWGEGEKTKGERNFIRSTRYKEYRKDAAAHSAVYANYY